MAKTEIILFIIVTALVMATFMTGLFIFLFQYRKKRSHYVDELNKKDAAHLRELHFARLEVQQQTMQDIGQEIHDSVGQKLTLAALYTQQLDYEGNYPEIKDRIVRISDIVNESIQELRNLSKGLNAGYFEQTTLASLIQHECNRVQASGKCIVNHQLDSQIDVNAPVKMVVVRIVQEFFQNSLKHADCSIIEVKLISDQGHYTLHMKDNGKGFDPSSTSDNAGAGLINFQRRAKLIGATIAFFSAPGNGTSLTLHFSV
jgi:signal transduction histidine kinase